MHKDFQKWHFKKSALHEHAPRVFFHEREIWWCRLGLNVGFEQDGKGNNFARPVVIFKKFNNEVFWAVPLTTRIKTGKFYLPVDLGDGIPRTFILSQLRLFDAKRLYQKIGVLDEINHNALVVAIIKLCKSL